MDGETEKLVAGGPITVPDDDEEELPEAESLQDLATRVRETEAMRAQDVLFAESPTEMYSATEPPEDKPVEVSPLMKLGNWWNLRRRPLRRRRVRRSLYMEVEKDEYDMITSESQKLKRFIPESLKMSWERGYVAVVLGKPDRLMPMDVLMESARSAKFMDVQVETKSEVIKDVKVNPSFVVKGSAQLSWDRAQSEERDKVLAGWHVVIAEAGDHCKVEAMIRQHGPQVLDDVFAKEKNGTLQVRLSAIMLYIRWARAKGLLPFPLDEGQCYAYVDQLRRDGAPATRAGSFRSALTFCKGPSSYGGLMTSCKVAGSQGQPAGAS